MSTLTIAEFNKQTGGGRYADVIIQEIIDQAEREINAWISLYELDVVTGDRFKASASLLAKAGLYERMHFDGGLPGDSGAKYYNLEKKAAQLREAAKSLIIANPETSLGVSATNATHYMIKVNA